MPGRGLGDRQHRVANPAAVPLAELGGPERPRDIALQAQGAREGAAVPDQGPRACVATITGPYGRDRKVEGQVSWSGLVQVILCYIKIRLCLVTLKFNDPWSGNDDSECHVSSLEHPAIPTRSDDSDAGLAICCAAKTCILSDIKIACSKRKVGCHRGNDRSEIKS